MMDRIRGFSSQETPVVGARDVQEAPDQMRQEFVAALYAVAAETASPFAAQSLDVDDDLYFVIEQTLGEVAAGNPMGGRRQRIGRDIARTSWSRFYDLVVALWPYFLRRNVHEQYRVAVNRLLAAYRIAWELRDDGHLHRVLPQPMVAQVNVAFAELSDPRYSGALALAIAARDAYDARPRRDRDACGNAFDAMESAAQTRLQMSGRRFDDVVAAVRVRGMFHPSTVDVLEKVNALRHRTFGHGTTGPFALSPAETDFVYLSCMSGIILFVRA